MARILIVDDEQFIRESISGALNRDGHETLVAENPSGALKLIEHQSPDLIISDICMEGSDGLSFLEGLRGNPRTESIPFIFITAYPTLEGMQQGSANAADGFLPKPFSLETLRSTVRSRLNRQAALRRDAAEIKTQLFRVLQASPDLIGMVDAMTLRLFYLNPAGQRMLETGEDYSRPLASFLPRAAGSSFERELLGLDADPCSTETELVSGAGRRVPVQLTIQSHRPNAGDAGYFSIVARDLTEQKQHESAIRASECRFRCLVDSLPDGVLMCDPKGVISFCNAQAARLSGYTTSELLGMSRDQLLKRAAEESSHGHTRFAGPGPAASEVLLAQKDGSLVPVSLLIKHLGIEGQTLDLCILHDLSERKRIERERQEFEVQLRQAQKLESIGQLAAGIAHEINTPTQYIGDNIRFLKDGFASLAIVLQAFSDLARAAESGLLEQERVAAVQAQAQKIDLDYLLGEIPRAIDQSLEGIDRVSKILRAMKDFSHPHSADKSLVDLNSAIESTVTVARNEWKYVASMEKRFQRDLPLVPCLPGEFNQVILNLIVNAAHAIGDAVRGGDRKGVITVSTAQDGPWVEVKISDTGTGIPESARARIFEPFFTTKEVGKGTGQGLAIARSVVVDRHGGTIRFETETGKGTSFIIRLPLSPPSRPQ